MGYKILEDNISAASDKTTEWAKYDESYTWSLMVIPSGQDANYKISIEVSNDKINPAPYKLTLKEYTLNVNKLIFDTTLPGDYIRFKYHANGNTVGNVTLQFNNKHSE